MSITTKTIKVGHKKNKLATALTQRYANAVASLLAMRTQSSANVRPAKKGQAFNQSRNAPLVRTKLHA